MRCIFALKCKQIIETTVVKNHKLTLTELLLEYRNFDVFGLYVQGDNLATESDENYVPVAAGRPSVHRSVPKHSHIKKHFKLAVKGSV